MFGLNKKIKEAFDRTYKKVIGKEYRDKMIKKNQSDLYDFFLKSNNQQDNFEFYSTLKETYNHEYKIHIKSLRSQIEKKIKYSEELIAVKALNFILIVNPFFWTLMNFVNDSDRMKMGVKPSEYSYLECPTFFIITAITVYLIRKYCLNKIFKFINEAKYEKKQLSDFFRKYKTAISLQNKSLLLVDKTSEIKEENWTYEIDYTSIEKVFLTAQHEKIVFKGRFQEKLVIETDEYKTAKVKVLNLLMPDKTIFSIVSPSGPNGETVEQLRDLIESRMLGTPVKSSVWSEDKIAI